MLQTLRGGEYCIIGIEEKGFHAPRTTNCQFYSIASENVFSALLICRVSVFRTCARVSPRREAKLRLVQGHLLASARTTSMKYTKEDFCLHSYRSLSWAEASSSANLVHKGVGIRSEDCAHKSWDLDTQITEIVHKFLTKR